MLKTTSDFNVQEKGVPENSWLELCKKKQKNNILKSI